MMQLLPIFLMQVLILIFVTIVLDGVSESLEESTLNSGVFQRCFWLSLEVFCNPWHAQGRLHVVLLNRFCYQGGFLGICGDDEDGKVIMKGFCIYPESDCDFTFYESTILDLSQFEDVFCTVPWLCQLLHQYMSALDWMQSLCRHRFLYWRRNECMIEVWCCACQEKISIFENVGCLACQS